MGLDTLLCEAGVGQDEPRGPFQPQPFCDCLILYSKQRYSMSGTCSRHQKFGTALAAAPSNRHRSAEAELMVVQPPGRKPLVTWATCLWGMHTVSLCPTKTTMRICPIICFISLCSYPAYSPTNKYYLSAASQIHSQWIKLRFTRDTFSVQTN